MNFPTHLYDRLKEIEDELTDPRLRRPAPFVRLRGMKDLPISYGKLHIQGRREHSPLRTVFDEELGRQALLNTVSEAVLFEDLTAQPASELL
jgi:hypothetical protein